MTTLTTRTSPQPTASTRRRRAQARRALPLAVVLALGLGACSVNVSGPSHGEATAPDGAATTVARQTSDSEDVTTSPATPSPDATTAPGPEPTAAGGATEAEERPGADTTITDEDWLAAEQSLDSTQACTGALIIDRANADVRVEGSCTTLTVSGTNATVVADEVGTLVVEGANAEVYVRDVDHVVVRGANADIVWAGATPVVEDHGDNTVTRPAR